MITFAKQVRFDDSSMWVDLSDGRSMGVPLAWFPRLLDASHEQRNRVELSLGGLHWDELDEEMSIDGLLAGRWGYDPGWARGGLTAKQRERGDKKRHILTLSGTRQALLQRSFLATTSPGKLLLQPESPC